VKVLLDENLPHRLRLRLGSHEAEEGDQTLSYEQNLTGRRIAVLVLSTIDRDIINNNAPLIVAALDAVTPGSVRQVDCGTFSRNKQPGE
jgi:hypothetical protein